MNYIFVQKLIRLSTFKKLAGDTAIYGMSSIIGRFLNWWLMPLYVALFAPDVYGIVTNLYSYVAFFMVFLTYGMETGFLDLRQTIKIQTQFIPLRSFLFFQPH